MKLNIKPLADRVLLEPMEAETKTASGIIIPDNAKEKPQKAKSSSGNESKETVMMSFVNSIKKARAERTAEKTSSTSDLPRPDVPRDIEEPTLMDVLKNEENEEDDSI